LLEGRTTRPSDLRSSLNEMSDALLVSAAKSGDAIAFVELSTRHSEVILRRTYRIVGNWQDAEDALQDSFRDQFRTYDFAEEARSY
jgi:DNA-directed RNA polymerase specialized sigma24 family protein